MTGPLNVHALVRAYELVATPTSIWYQTGKSSSRDVAVVIRLLMNVNGFPAPPEDVGEDLFDLVQTINTIGPAEDAIGPAEE